MSSMAFGRKSLLAGEFDFVFFDLAIFEKAVAERSRDEGAKKDGFFILFQDRDLRSRLGDF